MHSSNKAPSTARLPAQVVHACRLQVFRGEPALQQRDSTSSHAGVADAFEAVDVEAPNRTYGAIPVVGRWKIRGC